MRLDPVGAKLAERSVCEVEIWSFFSGAMGLDLGLEQGGLRVSMANENDRRCCETIRLNRPDVDLLEADIQTLSGSSLRAARGFDDDVHLMVGGPPCQSFSPGGKRASLADPRGNLIYEYFRLVSEVRPRYFVFENVANITTAALRHRPIAERPGKHWNLKMYDDPKRNVGDAPPLEPDEKSGSAIREVLSTVSELGYGVVFDVLDAADYGTPQHRLRFIMIGVRDTFQPSLPEPVYGPRGSGLRAYRTVRDAIRDLRDDPGLGSRYTEAVARFFDHVPAGGNWRDLPPDLQPQALGGAWSSGGGKTGFFRRLPWNAPSPTITGRPNRKGSALCHPEAVRPISVREAAALQGFPPEWRFAGSMNAQYLQIGNAVPVQLGKAIASCIRDPDLTRSSPAKSFDLMLSESVARLRASARNKRGSSDRQMSAFG